MKWETKLQNVVNNGKKEKNNITIEIEPIVSKYMWNKVNKV